MKKQAMIFAAGLGTRLKPVTDSLPKALVEINGKTMLDRVIDNLIRNGYRNIVVNVHHFADTIIEHIRRNKYDAEITISDERELLLDTAGGVRKAIGMIDADSPLLIHNADILTDIDLSLMSDSLCDDDALLLCSDRRKSSRYLLFDNDCRMHGWINENTGEIRPQGILPDSMQKMAFGGIHIVGPKILSALKSYIENKTPYSIIPFYIDVCNELKIKAYMPTAEYQWFDIGSLEKLNQARESYIERT